MPNPMIRIHNVETDEVIDRAMNAKEFAEYEAQKKIDEAKAAEAAATAKTKADLLARLGLTADEAALLLS